MYAGLQILSTKGASGICCYVVVTLLLPLLLLLLLLLLSRFRLAGNAVLLLVGVHD